MNNTKHLAVLTMVNLLLISGNSAAQEACSPAVPDLVACWNADGDVSTGTAEDKVGNNYGHMSDYVNVVPQAVIGEAYQFFIGPWQGQVIEPRIDIRNDHSISLPDEITVSAWINPSETVGRDTVFGQWHTTQEDTSKFSLDILSNKLNGRVVSDQGTVHEVYGVTSIPLTEWTHVALTYDGTDLALYFNGQLEATASAPAQLFNSPKPFTIGALPTVHPNLTHRYRNYFIGMMDEVRLYDVALQEADIRTLAGEIVIDDSQGIATPGSEVKSSISIPLIAQNDPNKIVLIRHPRRSPVHWNQQGAYQTVSAKVGASFEWQFTTSFAGTYDIEVNIPAPGTADGAYTISNIGTFPLDQSAVGLHPLDPAGISLAANTTYTVTLSAPSGAAGSLIADELRVIRTSP